MQCVLFSECSHVGGVPLCCINLGGGRGEGREGEMGGRGRRGRGERGIGGREAE